MEAVRIGVVPGNATTIAPVYVAIERGYFAERGIEPELVPVPLSQNATQLLATGELDAAATGFTAATLNAVAAGVDLKVVASLGQPAKDSPPPLIVRKPLVDTGQVNDVADLRARRIAIGGGLGNNPAYNVSRVLRAAGLTFADVVVVPVDSIPSGVAAFTSGAVDAAFLPTAAATQLEDQGAGVRIGDPSVVRGGQAMLYRGAFIAERPEVARALLVALVRAARDLQDDGGRGEGTLAILSKYSQSPVTDADVDEFDANLDVKSDTIDVLDMQQFFATAGALNYSPLLSLDRLVDTALVHAAAEEVN